MERRRKRIIWPWLLVLSFVAIFAALYFSGSIERTRQVWADIFDYMDANSLSAYSAQLFEYPLPPDTEILETQVIKDRLHMGNNKRLEDTALMLVRSQLTADELVAYYTPMVEAAWGPRPLFDPYFDDPGPVGLYIDPAEGASYQPEYNEQYPFYFESYPQGQDTAGLYYISIHY